ncbi:MAG: hypothetical protein PHI13_05010 [Methylococcales bacterium]|nr:hypothetical protein [Methylococcales bacterium]
MTALVECRVKVDEAVGIRRLKEQAAYCFSPLPSQSWLLDADVTVKPLYGKQEGAGYPLFTKNPFDMIHHIPKRMVFNGLH